MAGAERWLEAERGRLLAWDAAALADLADGGRVSWVTFVNTTAKGELWAVSRDGPLARYVRVTGLVGQHLLARTAAHRWRMEVAGASPATLLRLWLDGAPFGAWRLDDGALLDAGGAAVGRAARPATFTVGGAPTTWAGRWYDVVLRGRPVGRVRAQRGAGEVLPGGNGGRLPAVEPVHRPPAAEAERWLLALVLAERLLRGYTWRVGPVGGSLRPGALG